MQHARAQTHRHRRASACNHAGVAHVQRSTHLGAKSAMLHFLLVMLLPRLEHDFKLFAPQLVQVLVSRYCPDLPILCVCVCVCVSSSAVVSIIILIHK